MRGDWPEWLTRTAPPCASTQNMNEMSHSHTMSYVGTGRAHLLQSVVKGMEYIFVVVRKGDKH